jgi:hypothetical protein
MMKAKAILLPVFTLLGGLYAGSQLQQPALSVGGVLLQLDMSKQEALKGLSACCKAVPFGKAAVIITEKNDINRALGMLYFYGSKVEGMAADRDWSPEPASYETASAFYRLVDEMTNGSPAKVTLYSSSREMSNGSGKAVTIMQGARRIRMELQVVDPSVKNMAHQGVTVSECVGACTDWY